MALQAHKAIEMLRRGKCIHIPGLSKDNTQKMANDIYRANKFEFISLNSISLGDGKHLLPDVNQGSIAAFRGRLLPLPFELCYFEYRLNKSLSAMVVREEGNLLFVRVLHFPDETKPNAPLFFDGFEAGFDPSNYEPYKNLEIIPRGNAKGWLKMKKDHQRAVMSFEGQDVTTLVNLLTLINNKDKSDHTRSTIDQSVNSARKKALKIKLFDHTVITIKPTLSARSEPQGGTHASPSYRHHRRGHTRTYHRGTEKEFTITITATEVAKDKPLRTERTYEVQAQLTS